MVNFTYRLSPESKFPCHLEDTVKVFDWVKKNADKFGMDTEHVFAVGDSAGGHILSLYCSIVTNPEYASKYDFKATEGVVPTAVALNCAVLDMETIKESEASNTLTLMKDVLPKGKIEEYLKLANPIAHLTENFPPCFIMTSNDDFLRDQPESFKKKLEACGVPYRYTFYGDEENKLGHVFHLDMRNEVGRLCNDEECEYFRSFVG